MSRDTFKRTWKIEKHSYSQAAGKSSYHYSVCKPMGSRVDIGYKSSASFEQPKRSAVRPVPIRFGSGGLYDRGRDALYDTRRHESFGAGPNTDRYQTGGKPYPRGLNATQ